MPTLCAITQFDKPGLTLRLVKRTKRGVSLYRVITLCPDKPAALGDWQLTLNEALREYRKAKRQ